jgi:hypothetical protein
MNIITSQTMYMFLTLLVYLNIRGFSLAYPLTIATNFLVYFLHQTINLWEFPHVHHVTLYFMPFIMFSSS